MQHRGERRRRANRKRTQRENTQRKEEETKCKQAGKNRRSGEKDINNILLSPLLPAPSLRSHRWRACNERPASWPLRAVRADTSSPSGLHPPPFAGPHLFLRAMRHFPGKLVLLSAACVYKGREPKAEVRSPRLPQSYIYLYTRSTTVDEHAMFCKKETGHCTVALVPRDSSIPGLIFRRTPSLSLSRMHAVPMSGSPRKELEV